MEAVRRASDRAVSIRLRRRSRLRLKLKVEINSREHFSVFGLKNHRFEVGSRWFSGATDIPTYELDELLGTKLRALYQRKKGRDLFDLGLALAAEAVAADRVVEAFAHYMEKDGTHITRAMFERNLAGKRDDPAFTADMTPLLASGQQWDFDAMYERVWRELVGRLPGEPWQGR